MHSPLCGKEQRISTWGFLNEILEEQSENGIIRAAGVSNFGVEHLRQLEEAGLPPPAVNQIEVRNDSEHLLDLHSRLATFSTSEQLHPHLQQHDIVEYCKSHDIHVQAYCPLLRGPQSQQSLGDGADWAGMPGKGWDAQVLRELSDKYSKSIAQILLRWSVQQGYAPQPKASSLSRLKENIDIFNFMLLPEEIQRIDMEMDLTEDEAFKGKRIALEWNPVDCP
ncbi:hypothetical protein QFC19_003061 [Naganishia cerealis]|uniref:Uncharacterized protein n=1 Tax=Naganishia cerealis TaxID=610337 RepID=A0ACC2W4S7_9TREE|nr:hypothetical protein QFC19_003061 [Naganishia cerealis]